MVRVNGINWPEDKPFCNCGCGQKYGNSYVYRYWEHFVWFFVDTSHAQKWERERQPSVTGG